MNPLQAQLIENTRDLPKQLLQEVVDFSEFIKQKFQEQGSKKRMEQSETDIKDGRVSCTTPDQLFKDLGI